MEPDNTLLLSLENLHVSLYWNVCDDNFGTIASFPPTLMGSVLGKTSLKMLGKTMSQASDSVFIIT